MISRTTSQYKKGFTNFSESNPTVNTARVWHCEAHEPKISKRMSLGVWPNQPKAQQRPTLSTRPIHMNSRIEIKWKRCTG